MDRTLKLNSEEVNYFDLEMYLIKNCKDMFAPEPIRRWNSIFEPGLQVGQTIRYEFDDLVDVELTEGMEDEFSLRVRSPHYNEGYRIFDELRDIMGLTRRSTH